MCDDVDVDDWAIPVEISDIFSTIRPIGILVVEWEKKQHNSGCFITSYLSDDDVALCNLLFCLSHQQVRAPVRSWVTAADL